MVSEIVVYDDSPIQTRGTERQQRTSVQIADVDQALAPSALFEDDHRPSSIDEVLGDDAARAALERSINTHSVIISGQPGTGRTTMAKIIADHLQREAGPDQVAVFDARTIGDDQFDTVATREANVDSMQQVRQHIWDETLSTLRAQPDMRAEAIVAREKVAKKRVVDIADDPDSEE
jgi:Cdc6-like AAA superfamily ATPase